MNLEVLNLISLIPKAPSKEEGYNKIVFMTVYCTRFTPVDNCLKILIITVIRNIDMEVICFCFILLCEVSLYVTYIHMYFYIYSRFFWYI